MENTRIFCRWVIPLLHSHQYSGISGGIFMENPSPENENFVDVIECDSHSNREKLSEASEAIFKKLFCYRKRDKKLIKYFSVVSFADWRRELFVCRFFGKVEEKHNVKIKYNRWRMIHTFFRGHRQTTLGTELEENDSKAYLIFVFFFLNASGKLEPSNVCRNLLLLPINHWKQFRVHKHFSEKLWFVRFLLQ